MAPIIILTLLQIFLSFSKGEPEWMDDASSRGAEKADELPLPHIDGEIPPLAIVFQSMS